MTLFYICLEHSAISSASNCLLIVPVFFDLFVTILFVINSRRECIIYEFTIQTNKTMYPQCIVASIHYRLKESESSSA